MDDTLKALFDVSRDKVLVNAFNNGGGILSDEMIRAFVKIDPLAETCPDDVISYGLTAYGYDMRVDRHFKVFHNAYPETIVDPKNFKASAFMDVETDRCIIPPNSFVLGVSVERFEIPRGVLAVCLGKSSYARCGLVVNVTPLEPEWRGKVTIEISNTTPLPAAVYAGEGISQVIFIKGLIDCKVSYADKKGRYQDQKALTLPFVTGKNQ
jgi:dCTP deaminase